MLMLLQITLQLFKPLKNTNKPKIPKKRKLKVFKRTRINDSLLSSFRKHEKYIAKVLLVSYISAPGILMADGISVAVNSANAPVLDSASNGTPIININTPSSQGLSHNEYDQFNVNSQGLIFNNSTAITDTSLAGYINANGRLGGVSASVILNEVLGTSRSALNGYMEIAGQQAELVIANQNGITCNGCGFINTSRGVLTTGEVVFDGDSLSKYNVTEGNVILEGLGLNSPDTEYVDILARSIQVNGELWANNATLITGQNDISHERGNNQNLSVAKLNSVNTTAPEFALDVAAIGGMYANRITLIGTESGLGVKLGGDMIASEDIVLQADGTITNKGAISAQNTSIEATSFDNEGNNALLVQDNLMLSSTGDITNKDGAVIYSFNDATLQADGQFVNSSARVETVNNLSITATDIINEKSDFLVEDDIEVTSHSENLGASGKYYSRTRAYKQTITTPTLLTDSEQGRILSAGDIDLTAANDIDNNYSVISANGTLAISAKNVNNVAHSAEQSTVDKGTDTLKYNESYCKVDSFAGCVWHSTRSRTNNSAYNKTTSETVSFASATLSAGTLEISDGTLVNNDGPVSDVTYESVDDIDKLFDNAMYSPDNNPDSDYVFETNPAFTMYKNFVSSDYFLDSLDTSNTSSKRLGDGFLEQQYLRDQLLDITGQQLTPEYDNIEDLYEGFMTNALNQHLDLNLSVGIALTKEQIQNLAEPIVWMVEEIIDTANGPVTALVPTVYFPDASDMILRSDGAFIAANSIDIEGDLINSGTIVASESIKVDANNIENIGALNSKGEISLTAESDIINKSGQIAAVDALSIAAGGDFISETVKNEIVNAGNSYSTTQTQVGKTASLGGDSIVISAGNDLTLKGSDLNAENDATLSANNNINLSSLKVETNSVNGNHESSSTINNQVSNLSAGQITLEASNDITIEGAQVVAENDINLNATNIDLLAVKNTSDDMTHIGSNDNYSESKSHTEEAISTILTSGGGLSLAASEDIFSEGTNIASEGDIVLSAGENVTLTTVTTTQSASETSKNKSSNFLNNKTTVAVTSTESINNQGTNINSNGNIAITSGNDLILNGSTAKADGSIEVDAIGNVELLAVVDESTESSNYQKKSSYKFKNKSEGSIEQSSVGSGLIANEDLTVQSGESITLEASTLSSNDTLSLATNGSASNSPVTQDENGNYVTADGVVTGDITVTTQALTNTSWDESSSGYRGVFKELATLAAVTAGSLGIKSEIKISESDSITSKDTSQQASSLEANDLNIDADNDVSIIGSDIYAANNAGINAQNVTIDAAKESKVKTESHSEMVISSDAPSFSAETGELTVVSLTTVDQTETSTNKEENWSGSNLDVGNLVINAEENIDILASNINVENDVSLDGENVLIGGRQDTIETTYDVETQTNTLTVGVKNAYVDAALAIKNLDDAHDAVKDAESDYKKAKLQFEAGNITSNDLEIYKSNVTVAEATQKSAITALALSVANAAANSGTSGFTATASGSTESESISTTTSTKTWNGSSITVGGNSTVNSANDLTVEGSNIAADQALTLEAKNVSIVAGKNSYNEVSETSTKGADGSISVSQASPDVAYSLSATDASSDKTISASTSTSSAIQAGELIINAEENIAIIASNIDVRNNADIEGQNILISGLEDTYEETSKSKSKTASVSQDVGNTYADAVGSLQTVYDKAESTFAKGTSSINDLESATKDLIDSQSLNNIVDFVTESKKR